MKTGSLLAIIFFIIVAVAHLLRFLFDISIVIGGVAVPAWVSVIAVVVPGLLAFLLWREAR